MNKLSIIPLALTISVVTTFAQTQPQVTKEMMRGSPVMFNGQRGQAQARVQAPQTEQTQGGMQASQEEVKMMYPTTGDAVIDAQLATLTKEMETKMKAISEEYRKKVEALVGNKVIKGRMMNNASGTLGRMPMRIENGQNGTTTQGGMVRGEMMINSQENDATGTHQENVQNRNTVRRPLPAVKVVQPGEGTGSIIGTFFRGIFEK